ncbi:TPA: hypothetical protein NIC13_004368 [Pseudomonas aeruginosa]|nr:hypothetical protein [Pseudomonas aeruginosa]
MKEVVIIEAPGKVGALKNILKSLRRTAEVVATFGSLYDLPKSSLGLDPDRLTPTGWEVANEKALSRLVEALEGAAVAWLMTDGDREGELIASQAATAIRQFCPGFGGQVHRIVATSMTKEAVSLAFAHPRAIERDLVLQALVRRGLDRAIGFLCSNQSIADNVAGRISAVLVGSVAHAPLENLTLKGRHPEGRDWRVSATATLAERRSLEALSEAFARGDPELFSGGVRRKVSLTAPPPLTGAEAILLVTSQLAIPVKDAERIIQQGYENGDLSYPRTDARQYSAETQARLRAYMRQHNTRAASRDRSWESAPRAQQAHESLHVLTNRVHLQASLDGLSKYDAALSLIARRSCAALAPDADVERTIIPQAVIDGYLGKRNLPSIHARIWKDEPESAGWMVLERDLVPTATLLAIPDDQAILSRIINQEIGRPSTIVGHVQNVLRRGWIEQGSLSERGLREFAFLQTSLPNLLVAPDLEQYLEGLHNVDLKDAIWDGARFMGFAPEALVTDARRFTKQVEWIALAEDAPALAGPT